MINNSSLSEDVFDAVRSRLVSASLVSDSKPVDIRVEYSEQSSRPQIVMEPVGYSESNWVFNDSEGLKNIPVVLSCYSKNSLSNAKLGDSVMGVLKANDISGLNLVDVSVSVDFTNVSETKFKSRTISANYERE